MKPGETRMLDWRGQEIKVGDVVVYPVRQSSSVWMVEGEVVELHSMIEDRWQTGHNEPGRMVPTQVGGVTVMRTRASGWHGGEDGRVEARLVKVGLDRLTIVIPAEVMEFARHPIRYVTDRTPEDEEEALAQVEAGPGEIWSLFPNEIEIDGRAT